MNTYKISEDLLKAVLENLSSQPLKIVYNLFSALSQLPKNEEKESSTIEKK